MHACCSCFWEYPRFAEQIQFCKYCTIPLQPNRGWHATDGTYSRPAEVDMLTGIPCCLQEAYACTFFALDLPVLQLMALACNHIQQMMHLSLRRPPPRPSPSFFSHPCFMLAVEGSREPAVISD